MGEVEKKLNLDYYVVTWLVHVELNGTRLDSFLKKFNRRRSREKIQKQIEMGFVEVVRTIAHLQLGKIKPSTILFTGDIVKLRTNRRPEPPVSFDYKILFEDADLLVVDKPGNLPVHPAGRYYYHSLIVHLKTDGFRKDLNAERELFLVHRIDRETSGIMIIAKNREVCEALTHQFRSRQTEKRYFALVKGKMKEERVVIETPIGKPKTYRISLKMVPLPVEEGGLTAKTTVHRLAVVGEFTWVECFPKTGRQHQIRVHLESIGFPLVGDKLYGLSEDDAVLLLDLAAPKSKSGAPLKIARPQKNLPPRFIPPEIEAKLLLDRHALHSSGLRITHPKTKKLLEFTSELPQDLMDFLLKHSGKKKISPESSDWEKKTPPPNKKKSIPR